MVPIASLWLPIVVSAVIVFVASSVIHMFLPWHKGDIKPAPNQDATQKLFRDLKLAPGDYGVPFPESREGMNSPEFKKRVAEGPLVLFNVAPGGDAGMGKQLGLWFFYTVVVGVFTAYITGRALGPGADYLRVFQIAGCATFLSYSMALPQASIWWRKDWTATIKSMIDGLVYGALTAGTFGWLWPR